jgi:hypothetical protein
MSEAQEPQTQATAAPKQPPSVPTVPISQTTAINADTSLFGTPKMESVIKDLKNDERA